MRQRRRLMPTIAMAAAGAASLVFGTPAWAAATDGHNPPGDNGTVKIDGAPFEDEVDNQPHVTCDFELEFFNFDQGQQADITIAAQPPSGSTSTVVYQVKDQVISDDPASGAENDHDAVIRLSSKDLNLAGLTAQPQQGYHLKLTVDLTDGKGKAKQKVFWLQPCPSSDTSPTPSPGGQQPGSPGTPGGPGQNGDSGSSSSSLPITGAGVVGMAVLGLGLIGGGAALIIARRRRDAITFTS